MFSLGIHKKNNVLLNKIELLAPAQNKEFGISAINYGADAVYIGANKFGARSSAGNSISDIEMLIKYAHIYNSKVYVALNTILYNNELKDAEKLIHQIHQIGADALIIQDFGILEMDIPAIPIFASTQTHNIDLQKVNFLQKVGFSRVILGRELSLEQIKVIHKNTTIDLEAFVHGSLCVSYSGRCYLSHAIGGRSGNRGECAQPCRNKYCLTDSNGKSIITDKHLLSLKDINLSANIAEMIDAGISSFKIEGRLKDEQYVKNVTSYYRKKIDEVLNIKSEYKKSSSGIVLTDFIPNVNKTFNRGFSSYFLNGRTSDISSFDTPKSKGEFVGKIKAVDKLYIVLDSATEIKQGDGICFTNQDGNFNGCYINKVVDNKIFINTQGLSEGLEIYRNFDVDFVKSLSKSKTQRLILADFTFAETNNGFKLSAIDEDENSAELILIADKELATNTDLAKKNIIQSLQKSGDSIFKITNVIIDLKESYFIPAKILNKLRRDCLELLLEKRKESYIDNIGSIEKNNFPYPITEIDFSENISNELAEKFYLRHGVGLLSKAYELSQFASTDVVMKTKLCIKYELGECKTYNKKNDTKIPNFDSMYLINNGVKLKLDFICKDCYMNVTVVAKR